MNRVLHTMLRVSNLQDSIKFYTQVLGMKLLRTFDRPEDKFTLAFLGYEDESKTTVIELTYNYGIENYDLGEGYGHIAIGVDDCYKACDEIASQGASIIRPAGKLKGSDEIIAFTTDPDGYQIELIQR